MKQSTKVANTTGLVIMWLVFILSAFVQWRWWPGDWSDDARFVMVIIGGFLSGAGWILAKENSS